MPSQASAFRKRPAPQAPRVPLPAGVSEAQWALERVRWQNPRIKTFLGAIRLLGTVLESNYAILHCSPERLLDIRRKVRSVSDLMRRRLRPLLDAPSPIPAIEATRVGTLEALSLLEVDVLAPLDRVPDPIPTDRLLEVRKLLCVSIGQLHAFLQDTFGQLMAADPRSSHDADYFLSRRFPQDIEEAEWLHATVERLDELMRSLDVERRKVLLPLLHGLASDGRLPAGDGWEGTHRFLRRLLDELTPRLHETLALRGIRFSEMEILDRYTIDIPLRCHLAFELRDRTAEIAARLDGGRRGFRRGARERDAEDVQAVLCRRIGELLKDVDRALRDIVAFVPIWLEGIEKRRALLLHRGPGDLSRPDVFD